MVEMNMARFDGLVADALDGIPEFLAELMDNVVILVEEDPPEPGLLGLYEGIPLTQRDDYGGMSMPDRITVYRRPLCEMANTEAELVEQVKITVVHEIAHHFGIDDHQLEQMGWG